MKLKILDNNGNFYNDDVVAMALNMWAEARGETPEGQQAIGHVVMNRLHNRLDWWGKNIIDIIYKKSQFSWTNKKKENGSQFEAMRTHDFQNDNKFLTMIMYSQNIINGNYKDNTGGATHYYANYITPPSWTIGATKTVTIGNHIFYKDVP